jgi:hypothetical protein
MQKHWQGYITALGSTPIPSSSNPPVGTFGAVSGETGFLDLNPKKPEIQARYDAMSGSWEGVHASEAAAKSGIFKTEHAQLHQRTFQTGT